MKMKPLISVIIPIYKAEKYIEKCVKCVLAQTYTNLEIILVNDGSPDRSGEICDCLAMDDSRIMVVHKENGGAATARNTGLDVMTGALVTFVDADDYMEPDYIEYLYTLLTENKVQVSSCGFKVIDDEGNKVTIDSLHQESGDGNEQVRIVTGNQMIKEDLQGHWEYVAPWGKLFEASLYDGVRYPAWSAHEDEPVFIQVFDKVENAAVSTKPLYYYVQHAGSLMNSAYSEKDRLTMLTMWRERISYYQDGKENHKELLNCVKQAYVAWNILYLSLHAHEMTKAQKKELKKELRCYVGCLFTNPHLFHKSYSMKLAFKALLTLINTNILRKRYVEK